jgi:hypothetical protein
MAIQWDQFPHGRIRLQIYARLARNDIARSSEDSLRHILLRRLQSLDDEDHRRYIEVEVRSLVEHLRCTRDIYREFVKSHRCRPVLEAQWVVLRFAVLPTAISILRRKVIEYARRTGVRARDLSLLFGVPTHTCYKNVGEGIGLICLPNLEDETAATDEELESMSKLIDEDSLLIFEDIRDKGGAVGRLFGGGPFSIDDPRGMLNSFGLGPKQSGVILPEWLEVRKKIWSQGRPWTEGLCDLFISVQEELMSQWRALPSDSLVHELWPSGQGSGFESIVVPRKDLLGGRTAQEGAAVPRNPAKRKSGRKPRISEDFIAYAGGLWLNAIVGAGNTVPNHRLREIAVALDKAGYLPPAKYLEGRCAQEIKDFNSRNSNSRIGPVQTWSELVSRGDKDHIRGMRRLLSRSSKRLNEHPLSGN